MVKIGEIDSTERAEANFFVIVLQYSALILKDP